MLGFTHSFPVLIEMLHLILLQQLKEFLNCLTHFFVQCAHHQCLCCVLFLRLMLLFVLTNPLT